MARGRVHQHYKTFWTPAYWQSYCEGHPVRRYRGQRERQLLLRLLRLEDGLRLLEAGCGYGRLSRPLLASAGVHWVGVELSPSMVRYCRQQLPGSPPVVQADIGELPFADGSFDRVLCTSVLVHLEDEQEGLAELVRVTRPGGRLVLSANNLLHPLGPLMQLRALFRRHYIQRSHLASFYRHQLERLGCRLEGVYGDTLLGVGLGPVGTVTLPPAWTLPLINKLDDWFESLLPYFGYELWFQAVKE